MKKNILFKPVYKVDILKTSFKFSTFLIQIIFLCAFSIFKIENMQAAIFTVTNTNDVGIGSLRQAILDANAAGGADVIEFNIGTGVQTIQPQTALPNIDDDLIIDGTTQSGFVNDPLIEIDGSIQVNGDILNFVGTAAGEIKALILNGGPESGVSFNACTGGLVDNCFIGTNDEGGAINGNDVDGILLTNTSGVIIQNSVLSGNGVNGILMIDGSSGNIVKGCMIGTDKSGMIDLGNVNRGVFLNASNNNTIGGDLESDRNIISGNTRHGVAITGIENTVKGNFIGLDQTGNNGLGNDRDGVIIQANNNIIGTATAANVISDNGIRGIELSGTSNGNIIHNNIVGLNAIGTAAIGNATGIFTGIDSNGNSIGGDQIDEGNVVSGNNNSGMLLKGEGQLVEGNKVGTNPIGDQELGNGTTGIRLDECDNCIVGGAEAGAGNIISGNTENGILIEDGSSGDKIIGNFIGTDITGFFPVPNNFGVALNGNSTNNTIGGTAGFEGNLISGNIAAGISVADGSNETLIFANQIGTNLDASGTIPNGGSGVLIGGAHDCMVGDGTTEGQNLISGNTLNGIRIQGGSTGNQILGNCIGTDLAGTGDLGNMEAGVSILESADNIIGSPTGRNIISGNTNGIQMDGGATQNNIFQNNFIGTDITGTVALPNDEFGISVFENSGANQLGGLNDGEGNLVSGNIFSGIISAADNQVIQGNKIGTDLTGTADLGNDDIGVFLNGVSNCVVENNLISGNQLNGVRINDGAFDNQVLGNKIGTNEAGDAEIENGGSGVFIFSSGVNIIGGANESESNLISGNALTGITVRDSDGCKILGNKIGTDLTGNISIPNSDAIFLRNGSDNTEIGGPNAGEGNLISGNEFDGIDIDSNAVATIIKGNTIGLNAAGTAALPNNDNGIEIEDSPNTIIGGTTLTEQNIISGNGDNGIEILNSDNCKIVGNKIGTDLTGENSIPNDDGIFLGNGTNNTEIGGTNIGEGNLISGNNFDGIDIDSNAVATIIKGNIIGLNVTGATALPNNDNGIEIEDSPNTVIGGTTLTERNIISGNGDNGIEIINNTGTDDAIIIGNFIGTDIDGTTAIGNVDIGVEIDANDVTIGGDEAGAGNLISGNEDVGILFSGDNGVIQGNKIGTDVNGEIAIPNFDTGIDAFGENVLIGGSNPGEGNLVSGNAAAGIISTGDNSSIKGNIVGMNISGLLPLSNESTGMVIDGTNIQIGGQGTDEGNLVSANESGGIDLIGGEDITIEGNIIGLDINGTGAAGNTNGAGINDSSQGQLTIGGTAESSRNIISDNEFGGITGFFALDGDILGNFIGTDITGVLDFGNGASGISFMVTHNYNIGGSSEGSANRIAFNESNGINLLNDLVFGSGLECENVLISENSIFENGVFGIAFLEDQTQVAIPVLTDVVSGDNPTVEGTLNGNLNTDYTLEFFKNVAANGSGNHEGETFIGRDVVTTDGAGNAAINSVLNIPVLEGEFVTVTAQELNRNTSEFSNGVAAGVLPVELVSLVARSFDSYIQLNWTTASETNNDGFFVERISQEGQWETITFIQGNGTKFSASQYSFIDERVQSGIEYYYRLKQVDFDGRMEYTKIVSARIEGSLSLGEFYPNPAQDFSNIDIFKSDSKNGNIEVFNLLGQKVYSKEINIENKDRLELSLIDLKPGKYIVRILIGNQFFERSLLKLQ